MGAVMIDWSLFVDSIPALIKGAGLSIQIMLFATVIGLVVGTCLALMQKSSFKGFKLFSYIYVTFFRGTPMLVQILCVFYVLPQLGVKIPAFWSCVLAIGFNSAAYLSQVLVTGLNAISVDEVDAAKTLGFSSWQIKQYIILPQCFRKTLPALGNELVTLLKDSSLASVIGVGELAKAGAIIRGRTYDAFTVLLAVTVIYLVMTICISGIIKYLEFRSSKPCSI